MIQSRIYKYWIADLHGMYFKLRCTMFYSYSQYSFSPLTTQTQLTNIFLTYSLKSQQEFFKLNSDMEEAFLCKKCWLSFVCLCCYFVQLQNRMLAENKRVNFLVN